MTDDREQMLYHLIEGQRLSFNAVRDTYFNHIQEIMDYIYTISKGKLTETQDGVINHILSEMDKTADNIAYEFETTTCDIIGTIMDENK